MIRASAISPGASTMKIIALEKRRTASRRFDEDLAIIDLQGRTVHRLNPTASDLWGIISGGGTYEQLTGYLCETYELDEVTAQRDVNAFLTSLEDAGLVRLEDAPSARVEDGVAACGGTR
jgi:hypothetical protein